MLHAKELRDGGFYWYLDAIGSPPQVVEVVGDDVLMVRFTGREDEDALAELAGSFVGPLRPPGAAQVLSDVEQKAVQAALSRRTAQVPGPARECGEGHPS
ncbi:hypothetical protein H8N03_20470 [Ramlibacter sp. USB13]|uniref:Uncharacterized protein n=1 Tax=Ramlibacter cellulosilyticus TaxID=2764187 RepID=A0A923SCX4_9BURK|nr:hypothetical protein [Ramlibacter cellulosilyticus]MBC5785334.1 hypothetical protein [Ramlibacter cellulosilyticus]